MTSAQDWGGPGTALARLLGVPGGAYGAPEDTGNPSAWHLALEYGTGPSGSYAYTPATEIDRGYVGSAIYIPAAMEVTGPVTLDGSPPLIVPAAAAGQVLVSDSQGNMTPQSIGAGAALEPSGDPSGVTDLANIQALVSLGTQVVTLAGGGPFYINAPVAANPAGTVIVGAGETATEIIQVTPGVPVISGTAVTALVLRGFRLSGGSQGISLTLTSGNTTYLDLADLRLLDQTGDAIVADNPIVSKLTRVVISGGGGRGIAITGGISGGFATSVHLDTCYVTSCAEAAYEISNARYLAMTATATDHCGAGYRLLNCASVTLTAPGAESTVPGGSPYLGQAFEINNCQDVLLSSPYSYANSQVAYWVTNGSRRVTLISPRENTPGGTATASIQVDSGCTAIVVQPDVTTATSYSGTVNLIGEPAGGTRSLDLTASGSNNVVRATSNTGSGSNTQPVVLAQGADTGVRAYAAQLASDTFARWVAAADGTQQWGPGNAARDVQIARSAAGVLSVTNLSSGRSFPLSQSGQYLCAPASYAPASMTVLTVTGTALAPFVPPATTVAAGSNGGQISAIATWSSPSAGVLDVASAAGLPSSGTITVATSTTPATVTYTGTAAGQLTGCQYVSGSATGTVSTGGAVTLVTSAAMTGSFTAPSSGSVFVAVSCVIFTSTGGDSIILGLAAHGTTTPVAPLVNWNDSGSGVYRAATVQFLVTGLTAGTSYNFDLIGANGAAGVATSIAAIGTTTASNTRGAPVTMSVQAV